MFVKSNRCDKVRWVRQEVSVIHSSMTKENSQLSGWEG